jgi:opacity protein-like surface antigen
MRPAKSILATAALALLLASPAAAEEKHHPDATPKAQPERPAMKRGMGMMRMDQCEPGMGMMCMMGQHMGMRDAMMAQRTERHLAALKADLKITDAQAKAWDDYAAAVTAAAKAMGEQRKAMMEKAGTATLPQRLDFHEATLVSHLEQLRKTKAAANALYAVLSDDQKKIADKAAMGMMMRGHMRGAQRQH